MKKNVLIVGIGLIGGSLMKAIHEEGKHRVLIYDVNEKITDYCVKHSYTNQVFQNLEEAVHHADIVILAAPITESIHILHQIDQMPLKKEIVVTDVSSVKSSIFDAASQLENKKIRFIGGHPMAGSHKSGVFAAKAHLFENAIYVLTPMDGSTEEDMHILRDVLKATKSKFLILRPEEHDEMTSVTSHFPHLIAASLVQQARKWESIHSYLPDLAAGGFRDITRIASSNPKMWQDIFQHNGTKLSKLLQDWISEMVTLKEFLDMNKKDEMISYLNEAKEYRDDLNTTGRGALPAYHDIYIDIKDQPGAIATVVHLIAEAAISIRNMRILEIRDDINGALRLSLTTEKDQQKAYQLLLEHGYDVSIEV